MKKYLLLLTLLIALPAFGQGARFGDGQPVISNLQPNNVLQSVPNAGISFCTYPANAVPCTNKATTYTDITLATPCATGTQVVLAGTNNCVATTDLLGNWGVWVASGSYSFTIQLPTGGYVGPYSVTLSSGSTAGVSSINATTGAITLTGGTNVTITQAGNNFTIAAPTPATTAIKPVAADSIQFVTPEGNDLRDGLSWGSSKGTIFGACEALPGGLTSPPTCGIGQIYFTNGSSANPTSGAGIWLMGTTDPNYASPPAGWLRYSGAVTITGVPNAGNNPNGHKGTAYLIGGSSADRNHPGIWISGANNTLEIDNAAIQYPGRGIVVGECSNNDRTGTCVSSAITFSNDTANLNDVIGNGPTWDLTGQSFWIWLIDCGGGGTDTVNSPSGDLAPAFLVDGRTNAGLGLIFFKNVNSDDGGIKFYAGSNVGQFSVDGLTTEALQTEPAVWISGTSTLVQSRVADVQLADSVGAAPCFENDTASVAGQNIVENCQFGSVLGPSTVFSQYQSTLSGQTISPLRNQQAGFFNGRTVGAQENTERAGAPTPVRFTNLATTIAASWTNSGNTTFTSSITDPFGGSNAGQFVSTSGQQNGYLRAVSNQSLSVGDYLIGGAFVRSQTANGFTGGIPIQLQSGGAPDACVNNFDPVQGDGEWVWVTSLCKITATPGTYAIGLYALYDATHTIQVFAPVFNYIPTGTISQNEMYAYTNSLMPYDKNCVIGTICGPLGELLGSIITKTTTYSALATDDVILCNGTFTTTLPIAGIPTGKIYHLKNIGTGTCTLAVSGGATDIDGALTWATSVQYTGIEVRWDGSQYWIF